MKVTTQGLVEIICFDDLFVVQFILWILGVMGSIVIVKFTQHL